MRPLRFRFAGGHAPPSRALNARARFLSVLASVTASIKAGDLNVSHRIARKMLGGKVVGEGVVWLHVTRKWRVLDVELVDLTGDHLAIFATIARRHGVHKGVKVRVLVVNAMSVSTGPDHAARIFRKGLRLGPDIVIGVECADFRAAHVDGYRADGTPGLPSFYWHQPGGIGSAESATVLGVARPFGTLDRKRSRVGSRATDEGKHHPSAHGRGIRERPILIGRVTTKELR